MSKVTVSVVLSVLVAIVHSEHRSPVVKCPTLPNPMYGRLVGACQEPRVGDDCTLECDRGYRRLGVSTIKCVQGSNGGVWANQFGLCERSLCPALVPEINGVQLSGECTGSKVNGICVAKCSKQTNIATVTLQCMANGEWSGTIPFCYQQAGSQQAGTQQQTQYGTRVCPNITPPTNSMTWGVCTNARSNNVCNFACHQRTRLQGFPSLLCNNDGTWSGPTPICV